MKYYAVIDTNVLVSAVLNYDSVPGSILQLSFGGLIVPVLNRQITAEYREVLARPKFKLPAVVIETIVGEIEKIALFVDEEELDEELPDPKDRVFYEVVMTERKSEEAYLVTGNIKHFPSKPFIVTPRPIFLFVLQIARAPYTALMEITMTAEDFTFTGIENALSNGLTTIVSTVSVVGLLLLIILEIALGWNYFKLLLEVVERYIVVGILCYTSPLAYSMGASKATVSVFCSWCRMVGSQLLLLVMNVWFLREFNSSMRQYAANGGALSTGKGSVFLWLFCALAFLKTAQRFNSYLASMGLNVAQTESSMGMELLMAARVITGFGGGFRSAGSVFRAGSTTSTAAAAAANGTTGFAAGFMGKFKGNTYVRDAVVQGGTRMGVGGAVGFFGRTFGGIAARNGATLTPESVASVATRSPGMSGTIAGDIADRSLGSYMPQLAGYRLSETKITGGQIHTVAANKNGKTVAVEMFHTEQFEKPEAPYALVTAADGSRWYQMASGDGAGAFYDPPEFLGTVDRQDRAEHFGTSEVQGAAVLSNAPKIYDTAEFSDASEVHGASTVSGSLLDTAKVAAAFPDAEEGTILRC